MLLTYFFGDDVFISYTRADAMTYAAGLANRLAARDFSCFLNEWGTPPDRDLPAPLKRALARSTILVLVGSEGVIRSSAVAREVSTFRKSGRTIVPIDFGGVLERTPWFEEIAGLARTPESPDALNTGEPSAQVLARIDKSFHFTRRNQRARRSFITAATLLLILTGLSVWTMNFARKEAARATDQANEAQKQRGVAVEEANKARKNREEADQKAAEAVKQAERAAEQERIAKEQERLSRSRALAAGSSAQLAIDPAASLNLALQAWTTQPTGEARVALRDALLHSHLESVVAGHTGAVDASSFNKDGSLVVLGVGPAAKILDAQTGSVVAELRGHTKPVRSAGFSQTDERLIVTSADDATVRIWEWRSGRPPVTLEEAGPDLRARFSPDGRLVVVTTAQTDRTCGQYRNYEGLLELNDSRVRVWDRAAAAWVGPTLRGACVGRGRGAAGAAVNAFTPDGRFIFFACEEAAAATDRPEASCSRTQVRDLQTGRTFTLEGDGRLLEAVVIEKAGAIVGHQVSGIPRVIRNRPFQMWDLTGAAVAEMVTTIDRLALSDGTLVTAFERNVYLWSLERKDLGTADSARSAPERVFTGHTGAVKSLAVSAGSRFILSAAEDRTTRVWDSVTGKTVAVLRGHADRIDGVAITRNLRRIVTASADGTARIWSAGMAQPVVDLAWTANEVRSATFTIEGGIVAADDNRVRTWHPARGEQRSPELQGSIKAVSRDGRVALTSAPDYHAFVYSSAGDRVVTLQGDGHWFRAATFAAQGRTIVTTDEDGRISIRDAASGRMIQQVAGESGSSLGVHVSGDGSRLVAMVGNNTLAVLDALTGAPIATLGKGLGRARLSHDGRLALTFGGGALASLWDADSGASLVDLKSDPDDRSGHRQPLLAAAFSPDGRRIVTVDPYAGVVWTLPARDQLTSMSHVVLERPNTDGGFKDAEFSPDGRQILTGHSNGAYLWDAASGSRLFRLAGSEPGEFRHAAFSADDRLVATLTSDGAVRIWQRRDGRLLQTMRAEAPDLMRVTFSSDCNLMLAGTTETSSETFAWRVADGRPVGHFRGHHPVVARQPDRILTIGRTESVRLWQTARAQSPEALAGLNGRIVHAAFSADGRYVTTVTSDLMEQVWDVQSGRRLASLRAHRGAINRVTFTPDGATVVTASTDGTAVLWRWRGNTVVTLRAGNAIADTVVGPDPRWVATSHANPRSDSSWSTRLWRVPDDGGRSTTITQSVLVDGQLAQFSPAGTHLLTIGEDHTVRLWKMDDRRPIVEFRGHTGTVSDASFSPDGQYVVSVSLDGNARVWETATGALMSELLEEGHSALYVAAFSRSGDLILTKGGALRVFSCVICGSGDDLAARARAAKPQPSPD